MVWHVRRDGGMAAWVAGMGCLVWAWTVLFFSYGACGLVDCHLVLGGLVMIFENGLLLSSRLYLLICLPRPAVPFWTC